MEREGGHKRGREKGEKGMLGPAYDFRICCDFWRPKEPVKVSWVVERREILFILVWIIHLGHTLHLVGLGLGGLGNLWRFPGLGILS